MESLAENMLYQLSIHSTYVYIMISLISFLESLAFLGLAVPGAVFVVTAGILSSKGYFNLYLLILFAVIGAIAGDIVSYYLGIYSFDRIKKSNLFKKNQDIYIKGEEFFIKYGFLSILIGRFIGILRPLVPFVAGVFEMKRVVFFVWAVISGILWGISYILSGYIFGEGIGFISSLKEVNIYLSLLVVVFFASYFYLKRNKWNI